MPVRKMTQSELDKLFGSGLIFMGMRQPKKNYEIEKVIEKQEEGLKRTSRNRRLMNSYRKSTR